jgi:hypothetical protein
VPKNAKNLSSLGGNCKKTKTDILKAFFLLENFIFLLRVFITKSFLMENLLLLPPLTFLIIKVGFGGNSLEASEGEQV